MSTLIKAVVVAGVVAVVVSPLPDIRRYAEISQT